jgi:hypothetical protein
LVLSKFPGNERLFQEVLEQVDIKPDDTRRLLLYMPNKWTVSIMLTVLPFYKNTGKGFEIITPYIPPCYAH